MSVIEMKGIKREYRMETRGKKSKDTQAVVVRALRGVDFSAEEGEFISVMGLFQQLNDKGKTIIMVTHEPELAAYTKRIITLRDGELVSDKPVKERRNAPCDLAKWNKDHALLTGVQE